MPWARIDDQANDDDKLNALCSDAFRLWVRGLVYCQKKLTDGFIAESAISHLSAFAKERDRGKLVTELCANLVVHKGPLWHREEGGYRMHDYHDYNDRSDSVRRERELSKQRMQKYRESRNGHRTNGEQTPGATVTNAVTRRVTNACVQRSTSMYHGTYEKQEPAPSAEYLPVEPVENRIVTFHRWNRSRETPSGKPAIHVLTALARDVLKTNPTVVDEGELLELVKVACGRSNLLYDSGSAAQAVEAARAQLRRRKDIPA